MTAMESSPSPLSHKIESQLDYSRFPKLKERRPFAHKSVYKTITPSELRDYFKVHHNIRVRDQEKYKTLVDYILQYAKELFAISIAIGMPKDLMIPLMERFMKDGITNDMIPDIGPKIERMFPEHHWRAKSDFLRNRYAFRAPVLSQGQKYEWISLDDDIPLPIISCDDYPKEGGFASVYKVTVHGQFLDPPVGQVRSFPFTSFH